MQPDVPTSTHPAAAPLVVADWKIDAETVASTCRDRIAGGALRLLVPAWLHGLDWVGDPFASVPCAQLQLDRISRLCADAGLHVMSADVGDPDPLSAICDAVDNRAVDRILLFAGGRHVAVAYPLSLARRAERLTGLPVNGFSVGGTPKPPRRRRLTAGHCETAAFGY